MTHLCEADLAKALGQSSAAVVITDLDGTIMYVNDRFTDMTGYTRDEATGQTPSLLQSERTPRAVYDQMWETIRAGNTWEGRVLNRRKPSKPTLPIRIAGGNPHSADNEYWAHLTISPVRNSEGEVYLYAATHLDVTQKIELEEMFDFERKEAGVRADIAVALQSKESLQDRLKESLQLLMGLDELDIENKGGVFVCNEERTHLDMFVMHGEFSQEFIDREQQIPFGNCLCGRAAVDGEMIISDDCFCDERHENTFVGMTNHGHYIVPLRAFGETIGVMFLYTAPYPSHDENRQRMLRDVGDLMALAIANDQIQRQLIEASEAAEQASKTKSEFLANMSHEIRTPLNGILGFTDMLRREGDSISGEDRTEWIETIHASGQHLLQLINNILDLSKVEAGQLDLEATKCNPMSMLADLASVMRVQATDKKIDLNIECSGSVPRTLMTDPTRLRQILTNLMGNAIKFTQKGAVTVRAQLENTADGQMGLVFEVIDTGMGIPEEKLGAIFDPFAQGDNSITRHFGGTGLGLTISKKLATALGGSLRASSTLGQGSTFSVSLPVGRADKLQLVDGFQTESVRKARASQNKADAVSEVRGHVLLVDDGATNRQLIELILKRAGAEVSTAQNGQEACELTQASRFDLILMDMQMPIMDGYTATEHIRAQGIETPIIALTASAMKGDRDRCIDAGCNDYLTKPVDIEELIEAAAKWIGAGGNTAGHAHGHSDRDTSPLPSTLPTDDADFRKIVLNYVDSLAGQLEDIEQAHACDDFIGLSGMAHRIIGSGGMAGFASLTEAASVLEQHIHEQDFESIAAAIEDLKHLTSRIVQGTQGLAPAGPSGVG